MKSRNGPIAVALIVAMLLTPLFAPQLEQPKTTGVLATLKTGQAVNLKETAERYLLTVIEGDLKIPQSHTVQEVGLDYVVLRDFAGFNEVRIPLTSVKAVVHFKGLVK
jgi:hypothetical protein